MQMITSLRQSKMCGLHKVCMANALLFTVTMCYMKIIFINFVRKKFRKNILSIVQICCNLLLPLILHTDYQSLHEIADKLCN